LTQFEVLVIMARIVVLAAAIITVATRGRLGLKRYQRLTEAESVEAPMLSAAVQAVPGNRLDRSEAQRLPAPVDATLKTLRRIRRHLKQQI
jgi:hypothetical protein